MRTTQDIISMSRAISNTESSRLISDHEINVFIAKGVELLGFNQFDEIPDYLRSVLDDYAASGIHRHLKERQASERNYDEFIRSVKRTYKDHPSCFMRGFRLRGHRESFRYDPHP